MSVVKLAIFFALLAATPSASASASAACDQVLTLNAPVAEAALRGLPAVFVGRVNRVEVVAPDSLLRDGFLTAFELGYRYRATFAVAHAWVGSEREVELEWADNCDYAFEVGERYVVFASDGELPGPLRASISWPTTPLSSAYAVVEDLDRAAERLWAGGLDVTPWER